MHFITFLKSSTAMIPPTIAPRTDFPMMTPSSAGGRKYPD